jgi:hypothetical protein
MTRFVTDHIVNADDKIQIAVTDEAGSGGANHRYEIAGYDSSTNPAAQNLIPGTTTIFFQNGTIPDKGVNGITQEVLIAIAIDRLRSFQAGPFACKENACALTHLEEAMHWLQQRTIKRIQRGVEGTYTA